MSPFTPLLLIFLPAIAINAGGDGAGFGAVSQSSPGRYTAPSTEPHTDPAGHTIGEKFGGGIVFYVYDNGQHGLIAATEDQNMGMPWYNGMTRRTGTDGDGLGAGAKNTAAIVSKLLPDDEKGSFAAKACADYSVKVGTETYKGWFLPSKFELNLLYQQKTMVGGFANTNYWSSTEFKSNSVWIQYFGNGHQRISNSEAYANAVRAVRAF